MSEDRLDKDETTQELLRKNLETNQEMLRLMRREFAWRRFSSVIKFLLLAGILGWGVVKFGPWIQRIWETWQDLLLFPSVM
jgi:hypothetical protein